MLRDGFGEKQYFHVLVAEWASDDGPKLDSTPVDPEKPSTSMPHNDKIVGHALYFYTYSTWEGRCLYLEDLCVREEYRSECALHLIPSYLVSCIILSFYTFRPWYRNSFDAGVCKGWNTYTLKTISSVFYIFSLYCCIYSWPVRKAVLG